MRVQRRGARVNGSDIASAAIAVVVLIVEGVMTWRSGHYIRTGRWFR